MKTQDEIVYNIYGEPSGTKHTCDCGFTSISFQNMNMIWNEHLAHCDVVNPPKPKAVVREQTKIVLRKCAKCGTRVPCSRRPSDPTLTLCTFCDDGWDL